MYTTNQMYTELGEKREEKTGEDIVPINYLKKLNSKNLKQIFIKILFIDDFWRIFLSLNSRLSHPPTYDLQPP